MELVGSFQGCVQNGRSEAMEVAAGGVNDEQALRGEKCGEELSESLGEGAAGLIGGDERVRGLRRTKKLCRSFDQRRDGVVEDNPAAGERRIRRAVVDQVSQLASGRNHNLIDFGEIVVLGSEPKDRGVGVACGRCMAGAGNGGRCLKG